LYYVAQQKPALAKVLQISDKSEDSSPDYVLTDWLFITEYTEKFCVFRAFREKYFRTPL